MSDLDSYNIPASLNLSCDELILEMIIDWHSPQTQLRSFPHLTPSGNHYVKKTGELQWNNLLNQHNSKQLQKSM